MQIKHLSSIKSSFIITPASEFSSVWIYYNTSVCQTNVLADLLSREQKQTLTITYYNVMYTFLQ